MSIPDLRMKAGNKCARAVKTEPDATNSAKHMRHKCRAMRRDPKIPPRSSTRASPIVASAAIVMFRQVNVEILGVVENMSYFSCPHCNGRIDVFGHGEGKHMAESFRVPFLGEIEIDPQIRIGGDTGKPVAAMGEDAPGGKSIFSVARRLVERLDQVNAAGAGPVVQIL
jgi:NUBPL iron-transfer P-loop NTPase